MSDSSFTQLQPYPAYKDSGVAWLGEIPAHWEIRRTKTVLRERSDKGYPNQPLLAATQTKGVVRKEEYENRTVLAMKDLHLLKLVCQGDFVISLRSFQGGIEYAREQGIISPAYTVLFPINSEMQGYLAWLFKSNPYIENLKLHVTGIRQGQNIDYQKLSRSAIPIPTLHEQSTIVRFLDFLNRRINRFIANRRRLIGLLNEQKQAIINQAVTRGLNPDAPMKPSGIEWLGEIPAHWETRRAKYYFREVDERSTSGDEELLSVSHITGVSPRSQKSITMFMASSYVGHKVCRPGDLVINTMWAWMGAMGIANQTGIVSPSYGVYRLLDEGSFVPKYLDHLLRIKRYISEYVIRSTGIRASRLRLYPDKFLEIPLICPPLDDQREIVAKIESETQQISNAINQVQREIDLIREYRTRLIADVVTGKVNVRQLAPAVDTLGDEELDLDDMDELIDDEGIGELDDEIAEEVAYADD